MSCLDLYETLKRLEANKSWKEMKCKEKKKVLSIVQQADQDRWSDS